LPNDRVIDGGSLRPTFAETPQPGLANARSTGAATIAREWPKTALRIGDWKVVADEKLTRFEAVQCATRLAGKKTSPPRTRHAGRADRSPQDAQHGN